MKIDFGNSTIAYANSLKIGNYVANKSNMGSVNANAGESNAVLYNRLTFKSNISTDVLKNFSNDLMKLKMSLKNNSDSNSEGILFDEFNQKCKEYKEMGIFDNQVADNSANQILQNSILDLVDKHREKAANDMCQSDLREMAARSDMSMFLVRALGITTGRVDISEKGIARMMELYSQKLKDGTLKSSNAEILGIDAFNEYCEKYNKDREAAKKDYDSYSLLVQKLDEVRNSLVRLFKGNKNYMQ